MNKIEQFKKIPTLKRMQVLVCTLVYLLFIIPLNFYVKQLDNC